MPDLYTYIIPFDDGAAPHPFGGICTLAICKPGIRENAKVGDWVAGFGSKNAPEGRNLSGKLVYAMKVTEVLTLQAYDQRCAAMWPNRIPDVNSLELSRRLGDCIYDYSVGGLMPTQRSGVHNTGNMERDRSGVNVLVSDHYYYFGSCPIPTPPTLAPIIPVNQGHQRPKNQPHVNDFIKWINGLGKPIGMHGWPQMNLHWLNNSSPVTHVSGCSVRANDSDIEYA